MEFILETLGKVGFEWRMGLFNLINFFIVFLILKRFAFKPVMKVIEDRQTAIKDGLDNFEKSKTELAMAERKAQDLIDEAKVEANRVIASAHDSAKETADQMKEKAKKEIEQLIVQAKKNIEIDRQDMREAIRKETVALVVAATGKFVEHKLDTKADTAYITKLLSDMKTS